MASSKKGIIVNTIIALVIAAVFVLMAYSILNNILCQFPRVDGSIGNTSEVVCIGDNGDHHMYCLNTANGNIVFSVGSGCWSSSDADSTPTLTKDTIYFGLGNHFMAYDDKGQQKWDYGVVSAGHTIMTGIALNEKLEMACFGAGTGHTVHCQNTEVGSQVFSVHSTWDDCPWWAHATGNNADQREVANSSASDKDAAKKADGLPGFGSAGGHEPARECRALSTPAIDNEGYVYLALGNHVCKYNGNTASGDNKPAEDDSEMWCQKFEWTISTGLVLNESGDMVCFGGGNDHKMRCLKTSDGSEAFTVHCNNWKGEGAGGCKAMSTPAIVNGSVYFGIGGRVCKYPMYTLGYQPGFVESKSNTNWCTDKFPHTVVTGIAVDESLQYACFGDGEAHAAYCVNTTNSKMNLNITAKGSWGDNDVISTPVITNRTLYAALGNHICAFTLPVTKGWENKNFESSKYNPMSDPDVLWKNAPDNGCQVFEHTIVTDVAAFKG